MPVAGPALGDGETDAGCKGIGFHSFAQAQCCESPVPRACSRTKSRSHDISCRDSPHRGQLFARRAGSRTKPGGPWDHATLATAHENVYAIGDVTAVPIPGSGSWTSRWRCLRPGVRARSGELLWLIASPPRLLAPCRKTRSRRRLPYAEAGGETVGFAFGNFFAEPSPQVELRQMGRVWHVGKVLFEQWWLALPGPRRRFEAGDPARGKVLGYLSSYSARLAIPISRGNLNDS